MATASLKADTKPLDLKRQRRNARALTAGNLILGTGYLFTACVGVKMQDFAFAMVTATLGILSLFGALWFYRKLKFAERMLQLQVDAK